MMNSPMSGQLHQQKLGIGINYPKNIETKINLKSSESEEDEPLIAEIGPREQGDEERRMRFNAIENIIFELSKRAKVKKTNVVKKPPLEQTLDHLMKLADPFGRLQKVDPNQSKTDAIKERVKKFNESKAVLAQQPIIMIPEE